MLSRWVVYSGSHRWNTVSGPRVADGACSGLSEGVAAEFIHNGDGPTAAVRSLPRVQSLGLWTKAEESGGLI